MGKQAFVAIRSTATITTTIVTTITEMPIALLSIGF